tara:strand:+ start:127 stop:459 length:333 start_codon:yes stop_codon:yes gene_type:complete
MSDQKSAALKRLEDLREELLKDGKWSDDLETMYQGELKGQQMDEAQEWFKLAEGPGMSAVSLSGLGRSGIGYAPQRDITKTFPGAMSEEEEEYQRMLRTRVGKPPGLMIG